MELSIGALRVSILKHDGRTELRIVPLTGDPILVLDNVGLFDQSEGLDIQSLGELIEALTLTIRDEGLGDSSSSLTIGDVIEVMNRSENEPIDELRKTRHVTWYSDLDNEVSDARASDGPGTSPS